MDNSALWIILAVVAALLVLGALVFAGRSRRHHKLHGQAERIREEVEQESVQIDRREALAGETEARARAAQAEAEAKSAEAERLAERAETHRAAAADSRADLDARREHADSIDPKVKDRDQADTDVVQDEAAAQVPDRAAEQRR